MFNQCEYIISAVTKSQFPNHNNLPEFVFLGRSNVGKSSLINAITNRKLLAKTSSKPGKTKTINFYLIDQKFYLIDVPGYGYASKSLDERIQFGNIIETYLTNNSNIKKVFLLVDTKVGPTKDDLLTLDYLRYLALPIAIVATKSDKVGITHLSRHIKDIQSKTKVPAILVTSADKKTGIQTIIDLLGA
ncbi:MAG: ribosome biogenesis GTP-binding protein YihA/YsxC [Bacilli bacterium]|jgi:GTP-binding protein|nr:ribosome biogenesis GTP-binding protein YihA/YsxC [Bacilli bacterium]MDY0064654.1 ribosome biogenesis GTP-binding protein YihA/YsxC [Bacilli bacterium]